MGKEEVERIKEIFNELRIDVKYIEHEPVLTSQQAASVRGMKLDEGIKAILFTDGNGNYTIVDVPANMKVNQKQVAETLKWKKSDIRMATPEEVIDITGCEIGSVPPFGHKTKIDILVDNGIYEKNKSSFNIGLRTHSADLETKEMKKVFLYCKAIEGNFAK